MGHRLEDFSNKVQGILSEPGPVFVHMKVIPEIETLPINQRSRWNLRTLDQVLADVRKALGVAG